VKEIRMNRPKQIMTIISLYALNACGSASDPGLQHSVQGAAGSSSLVLETAGSSASGGAGQTADPSAGANAGGSGGTNEGGSDNAAGGGGGDNSGFPSAGSAGRTMTGNGGSAGRAMSGNGGSAAQSGAPSAAGNSSVCASGDSCNTCLCRQCPAQVQACETTSGCRAIAECVRTTRCQGAACYCGSADVLTCAAGTANGPCREVILAAPGSRKPTLNNQSAGPAADAATAVGNCGAKIDTGCAASCQ
jgi:hypothetical protein